MRPDLDDILAGVQRLLQNDLVPGLASAPFLAEQAAYASLLLEYCRKTWPRAHLVLAEEHADLHATLGKVARELTSLGTAAVALLADLKRALEDTVGDSATTTLDVLSERNRTLRGFVSRIVALAESDPALADGTAGAKAMRAELDGYLGRLASRQRRELDVLGVNW